LKLAVLNENSPQLLHDAEKRLATLFDQDASQKRPEQTDIAAQRKIFGGIGGARSQLGEPAALVVIAAASASTCAASCTPSCTPGCTPKRRVTHVQS
jgi:hypothetical protein